MTKRRVEVTRVMGSGYVHGEEGMRGGGEGREGGTRERDERGGGTRLGSEMGEKEGQQTQHHTFGQFDSRITPGTLAAAHCMNT